MSEFEDMIDPPLADRLRAFEVVLKTEPCERLFETNMEYSPCDLLSQSTAMCPTCRLRIRFHHILYNAEAYEGGPGEIPRLRSTAKPKRNPATWGSFFD